MGHSPGHIMEKPFVFLGHVLVFRIAALLHQSKEIFQAGHHLLFAGYRIPFPVRHSLQSPEFATQFMAVLF